jgi:hypothetical protein
LPSCNRTMFRRLGLLLCPRLRLCLRLRPSLHPALRLRLPLLRLPLLCVQLHLLLLVLGVRIFLIPR